LINMQVVATELQTDLFRRLGNLDFELRRQKAAIPNPPWRPAIALHSSQLILDRTPARVSRLFDAFLLETRPEIGA